MPNFAISPVRAKAITLHLGVSVLIALVVAVVVFGFWYPYPYRDLVGGFHLFILLVVADVICGPLLVGVVFNPKKSRKELILDVSIVGVLQIAALVYGLHSISLARPAVLAFEVDRFVAVSASQLDTPALADAPIGLRDLSWTGPKLIGTRVPKDGEETLKSIELSMQGLAPSARPDWWQDYEISQPLVKQRMRKLTLLKDKLSQEKKDALASFLHKNGLEIGSLFYLPLVADKSIDDWVILLDEKANIAGFAPFDGFDD